ncbi:hypothetical protein, partial [Flavobacterium sp. ASV13]|uniref:hypothetical protein n=1 Tax=Flavobacterium sp. ASV13 TaxID=1506583 RepID=UPI001EE6E577
MQRKKYFGRFPLGRAVRCIFCGSSFREIEQLPVSRKRMPLPSLTRFGVNDKFQFQKISPK